MRCAQKIAVGIALLILGGCAGPAGSITRQTQQVGFAKSGVRVTAYLMFDHRPSQAFAGQDFTYRTEWPGVDGDYTGGRFTEYEERIIDREGDFVSPLSQTYRRFSSRRIGTSYR